MLHQRTDVLAPVMDFVSRCCLNVVPRNKQEKERCDPLERSAQAANLSARAWRGSMKPTDRQGIKLLVTPLGHPDFVAKHLQSVVQEHNVLLQRIPRVIDFFFSFSFFLLFFFSFFFFVFFFFFLPGAQNLIFLCLKFVTISHHISYQKLNFSARLGKYSFEASFPFFRPFFFFILFLFFFFFFSFC